MKKIHVKSQEELNAIADDYDGRIYIEFGTPYKPAMLDRKFRYSVVAYSNSSVEAHDNSSVVACGNSSVEACDNSRVVQCSDYIRIGISGNARIVHNPTNISEYLNFYGIDETNGNIKLYKAVHKCKNRYFSDKDRGFEYVLGEIATADILTESTRKNCGHGIHVAPINWCLDYGKNWNDLAILEVEAETDKIVVPQYTDGKVRTLSVKVLREVPLEECGLLGKMLAKRRAQREAAKVPEQESEV